MKVSIGQAGIRLMGEYSSTAEYKVSQAVKDSYGNWWVSKKGTKDNPNKGNPLPKIIDGKQEESEWWILGVNIQDCLEATEKANQAAKEVNTLIENTQDIVEKAKTSAEKAEKAVEDAEKAVEDATNVKKDAEKAVEDAGEATKSANDAAELAKEKAELAEDIANHPSRPGSNGFWEIYNPTTKKYEESDIPSTGGIEYPVFDIDTDTMELSVESNYGDDNKFAVDEETGEMCIVL